MPDWVSTLTTLPLTEFVPSAGYGPLVSVAATVQLPEAELVEEEELLLDELDALDVLDALDDDDDEDEVVDVPDEPPPPHAASTPPAPAPASRTSVRRRAIMRFKSSARLGDSGWSV